MKVYNGIFFKLNPGVMFDSYERTICCDCGKLDEYLLFELTGIS